jgi:hypothetical protein
VLPDIAEMREVKDLLPTEGLLLLDIRRTTGRQLIIKTIEELIVLGVIKIENHELDGRAFKIVRERDVKKQILKDYHDPFLLSIREHYEAYKEITRQNALTPERLLRHVRSKLDFSDNKYKFVHIYSRLELWDLVRTRFPFYYFNKSLTKKGQQLKIELHELLDRLRREIASKGTQERLVELNEKLGFNIILIPGVFEHLGQIITTNPRYFEGPELEISNSFLQWEILGNANLTLPEFEFFDTPEVD